MNLLDGLKHYEQETIFSEWASRIEMQTRDVFLLLGQFGTSPTPVALEKARVLLIEIEKWKAGCLQERMGSAIQNSDIDIWNALYRATTSTSDVQALLAIMKLKGFGSSRDIESGQQRAKVATSVLRFLWPDKWGVVDWRVAAMVGFLDKNDWDVEKSIVEAKRRQASEFRETFNIIDEKGAIAYNVRYRQISQQQGSALTRAADVDMAIFGLSLLAWPMP